MLNLAKRYCHATDYMGLGTGKQCQLLFIIFSAFMYARNL